MNLPSCSTHKTLVQLQEWRSACDSAATCSIAGTPAFAFCPAAQSLKGPVPGCMDRLWTAGRSLYFTEESRITCTGQSLHTENRPARGPGPLVSSTPWGTTSTGMPFGVGRTFLRPDISSNCGRQRLRLRLPTCERELLPGLCGNLVLGYLRTPQSLQDSR